MNENEPKIKDLARKLAKRGVYAMYGGKKGHGFWMYRVGRTIAEKLTEAFDPELFWNTCDALEETPIIKNDGRTSGNPCFWMFRSAAKYVEQI